MDFTSDGVLMGRLIGPNFPHFSLKFSGMTKVFDGDGDSTCCVYRPFQKVRQTRYQSQYGAACCIGVSFGRELFETVYRSKMSDHIIRIKHFILYIPVQVKPCSGTELEAGLNIQARARSAKARSML